MIEILMRLFVFQHNFTALHVFCSGFWDETMSLPEVVTLHLRYQKADEVWDGIRDHQRKEEVQDDVHACEIKEILAQYDYREMNDIEKIG